MLYIWFKIFINIIKMFYFYVFLFFFSSTLLGLQHIRNNLSIEFIYCFLFSLCFSNVFFMNHEHFENKIIKNENPIILFIYFLFVLVTLYSSVFFFIISSFQNYNFRNTVYFIEN